MSLNGDGFHGVTAINPPHANFEPDAFHGEPLRHAHSRGTVMFTWAVVGLPLIALAVAWLASFGYALAFVAGFWVVTAAFAAGRVAEERCWTRADLHP